MSAEAFLDWDARQDARHEFVHGEVFAMAGAEERHVMVAGNIYSALRAHLRGSPCRSFISDMKLRVEATDAFYYPDVLVTCSSRDAQDSLVKHEPSLLVEVLSPSTEAHDRGAKFAAYRSIASLREYLLVDIATRRCDLFRRNDIGQWVLHPFASHEALDLQSVGLTLAADDLWSEV